MDIVEQARDVTGIHEELIYKLADEIERLREHVVYYVSVSHERDYVKFNWELAQEIERLREALKPFAKEAVHWVNQPDTEPLVESFPGYEGEVTVGDCRRAFDILNDKE